MYKTYNLYYGMDFNAFGTQQKIYNWYLTQFILF